MSGPFIFIPSNTLKEGAFEIEQRRLRLRRSARWLRESARTSHHDRPTAPGTAGGRSISYPAGVDS
jgi:hypothetical protein